MPRDDSSAKLEQLLRREVAAFCRRDELIWKQAAVKTIRELKHMECPAVFFGGTLRSLLISRRCQNKPGRPRDIDIVIQGAPVEQLREHFEEIVSRETRFGGLQLRRENWQFDMWPLEKTWAFGQDSLEQPGFADLPKTTFFNLEAIAVDVWPRPGRPRRVFAGDGQFFDGIRNRVLEINREDNPFPSLCVVRALIFAGSLDFSLGPRLARYIVFEGEHMSCDDLEEIQMSHYGRIRQHGDVLKAWIQSVTSQYEGDDIVPVSLPLVRQLTLWPDEDIEPARIHIQSLPRNKWGTRDRSAQYRTSDGSVR